MDNIAIKVMVTETAHKVTVTIRGCDGCTLCWQYGANIQLHKTQTPLPELLGVCFMQLGTSLIREGKRLGLKYPFSQAEYIADLEPDDCLCCSEFKDNSTHYIDILRKAIMHAVES